MLDTERWKEAGFNVKVLGVGNDNINSKLRMNIY